MATFKEILIEDIISNRFRNFDLHPMKERGPHVKALVESFEKTGDFGVLPVRELEDGTYEQAAGHHRLAAMRMMGYSHADCKVLEEFESRDPDMVRIMVNENNTQQGNVNPAKLDSINAIMGQVAFALLLSDTPEQFCEVIGQANYEGASKLTARGMVEAKNRISKGETVPHIWLKAFDGDVVGNPHTVNELCGQLKDGGFLEATYAAVQAEVAEITEAKEEEERQQEKARKKAEERAELERLAFEKAKKAAKDAAARAKASEKVAAEARAVEAERIAKVKAKARADEAKKRQAEREAADAAKETRASAKRVVAEAVKASADMEKGLHPDVLHMLKASTHQAAFRKMVTGEENRKVFPIGQQPQVVRALIAHASSEEELTPAIIKEYLAGVVRKTSAAHRRMAEEREAREVKASVSKKVFAAIDDFRLTAAKTGNALMKLGKVLDDEKTRDFALVEIASDKQLSEMIDFLESMVMALRQNLTLRKSQYDKASIDAANEKRGKVVSSI